MSGRAPPGWRVEVGFLTDTGRVRERNEDAFKAFVAYPGEPNATGVDALFAVADGMGGHDAGDLASRFLIDTLEAELVAGRVGLGAGGVDCGGWIETRITAMHRELRELARRSGRRRGMGSTLTLAVVHAGRWHLGHVGDSRCYRWRDGRLQRLTRDDTWVAEQLRAGVASDAVGALHAQRHVLTQCLGIGRDVRVFRYEEALEPGVAYLLCSDGLHGVVDDDTIAGVLEEHAAEPQRAAARLVELANAAGGPDNVTALVVGVQQASPAATTGPRARAVVVRAASARASAAGGVERGRAGRRALWLAASAVTLALGGVGARAYLRPPAEPPPAAPPAAEAPREIPDRPRPDGRGDPDAGP